MKEILKTAGQVLVMCCIISLFVLNPRVYLLFAAGILLFIILAVFNIKSYLTHAIK